MKNDFVIVRKDILPATIDLFLECTNLIDNGMTISKACEEVGISRTVYYRYKDSIFSYDKKVEDKRAVISLMLKHKRGSLVSVLNYFLEYNCNILTINQNIAVNNKANVIICLDVSEAYIEITEMIEGLKNLEDISHTKLISVE